jgi:hypothetical protein
MGYYGKNQMTILRTKWLTDQMERRSFAEITNNSPEILLLVSGRSNITGLLESNGLHLEGKPVQYGHVTAAKYVRR